MLFGFPDQSVCVWSDSIVFSFNVTGKTKKEVNFSPGEERNQNRRVEIKLLYADKLFYLVLRKLSQW